MHLYIKKGFSLVELAAVLIVVGVIISISISGLRTQLSSSSITSTQQKLNAIKIALENYRTQYFKYPCPSYPNAGSNDSLNYGVAAATCYSMASSACPNSGSLVLNCTNNSVNTNLKDMVQGSIPHVTLGISQDLTEDSQGNKITYSIDARFTQDLNRCEMDGSLSVLDYNGFSVTNKAAYVLTSHGSDKKGAFAPASGTISVACDTAAKDGENCNNDNTFRLANVTNSNHNTLYYDDIIEFGVNTASQYCPAGLSNCQIWFDASDKCSVVSGSGGIRRLLNKTSNNYHAEQTTTGNQPDYSTAKLNNRNFIIFSAANTDALYSNVGSFLSEGPYSIVTVFSSGTASTTFNVVTNSPTFSAATFDRSHGLTGTFFRSYNRAASDEFITSSTAFNNSLPNVAVTTVGATSGSRTFINGASIGTRPGTASTRNTESTLILGSHTNLGAAGYNLMEYLYFNKELSDTERKTLEVYLANKWGINY
jgi:prepilin-type N-terminal cleavage/methylation domain-containing protein